MQGLRKEDLTHLKLENEIIYDLSLESLRGDILELRDRLEQMEGRNQILELVLKEYYVDEEIFKELEMARGHETREDREKRENSFRSDYRGTITEKKKQFNVLLELEKFNMLLKLENIDMFFKLEKINVLLKLEKVDMML
jgi:hypothetical protein